MKNSEAPLRESRIGRRVSLLCGTRGTFHVSHGSQCREDHAPAHVPGVPAAISLRLPHLSSEGLRFLIDLVGSDRIVVGTDSFNAKDIEYPSAVVEQFNFQAVDRDRILKGKIGRAHV